MKNAVQMYLFTINRSFKSHFSDEKNRDVGGMDVIMGLLLFEDLQGENTGAANNMDIDMTWSTDLKIQAEENHQGRNLSIAPLSQLKSVQSTVNNHLKLWCCEQSQVQTHGNRHLHWCVSSPR